MAARLFVALMLFALVICASALTGVSTCQQLQDMKNNLGEDYVLGNDIDCSATASWNSGAGFEPVGSTSTAVFAGNFDGQGYEISGLTINRPSAISVGLFGATSHETQISSVNLLGGRVIGFEYVGSLVGFNQGTISNSTTNVTVIADSVRAGGLAGSNSGTIITCSAAGIVDSQEFLGGLVGDNGGFISFSYATGNVTGGKPIGGLIATNSFDISDCYATGNIAVTTGGASGGLVGWNSADITNSYATGSVLVLDNVLAGGVGGLVGENIGGLISMSYATGNVTGLSDTVGGLVGINQVSISDCYAVGSVFSNGDAGGLMGYNDGGTISNCYAVGSVSGNSLKGGLVGRDNGGSVVTNSYWDNQTSGLATSNGGSAKTTSQMFKRATYLSWNFVTVWWLHEGINYPRLLTLSSPPSQSFSQSDSNSQSPTPSQSDSQSHSQSDSLSNSRSQSQSDSQSASFSSSGSRSYSHSQSFSQSFSASQSQSQGITFVTDCFDLQNMTNDLIGRYVLTGPIDCTETAAWNGGQGFEPIGTLAAPFSGIFTGNGYVITGLTINRPTIDNVGLFGMVDSTVQVHEAGLEAVSVRGRNQVGALVGLNQGSVDISYASGFVAGTSEVGGLFGRNDGTLSRSYAITAVTSSNNAAGGLVGRNEGSIDESYAAGLVSGGANAGGLVGLSSAGIATESYWDTMASSQLTSRGGTGKTAIEMHRVATFNAWDASNIWWLSCGAYPTLKAFHPAPVVPINISTCVELQSLCGERDYALVNDIDCSVSSTWHNGAGFVPLGANETAFTGSMAGNDHVITGLTINLSSTDNVGLFGVTSDTAQISKLRLINATIQGQNQVGMLIGLNHGSVTACYAQGSVSGNANVGGLIGRNSETAVVSQSAAEGALVGNGIAGGLVGLNEGAVEDSYTLVSTLIDAPKGKAGGLVGDNIGHLQRSYAAGCVRSPHGSAELGGLVGALSGHQGITACYWDRTTTGHIFLGPKSTQRNHGKKTGELYQAGTFKSWDFAATWDIEPGRSYPRLRALANVAVPIAPAEKCPSSALFGQWLTLAVSLISVMAFLFLLLLYGRNLFLLSRWRHQNKRPDWVAPAYLGQQDVVLHHLRKQATPEEKKSILEVLLENNHVSTVQAALEEKLVVVDDALRHAWGNKLAARGYHEMATCLGVEETAWQACCEAVRAQRKEKQNFHSAVEAGQHYFDLEGLKQDTRWPALKAAIERDQSISLREDASAEDVARFIGLSIAGLSTSALPYDGEDYFYDTNKMLAQGLNPNFLVEAGGAPLAEAVQKKHIPLAKRLVQHNANLYLSGATALPLEVLLQHGQRLTAQQMLVQGDYPPVLKQSLTQTLAAIDSNDAAVKTISLRAHLCDNYTVYLLCCALRENQHVEVLDLAYNEISLLGVMSMATLLHDHPRLRRIDLSYNLLDERGLAYLTKLFDSSPCLKEIEIAGNTLVPQDDPRVNVLKMALAARHSDAKPSAATPTAEPTPGNSAPQWLRFQVWFQHYQTMMVIAFLVEVADKVSDCILIRELAENREQQLAVASLTFLLASYVVGAVSVQQMRDPGQTHTWASRLKRLLWLPVLGPEFARLVWNVEYIDKRFAWLRLANFVVEDAPQFIVGVLFLERKGMNPAVLAKVVLAFCFSLFFMLKFLLYDFSAGRVKMRNALRNVTDRVQTRVSKSTSAAAGGIEMDTFGAGGDTHGW